MLAVVTEAGIEFSVVRIWPGASRDEERRLKKNSNVKRKCPVCYPTPGMQKFLYVPSWEKDLEDILTKAAAYPWITP